MALPSNVSLVKLTGEYVDYQGNPIAGSVRFTSSATVRDMLADTIIVSSTASATLDSTGSFEVTIPATNDPDIVDAFTYSVEESFAGGRSYTINLPVAAPLDRTNLILNPSAETNATGWSSAHNLTRTLVSPNAAIGDYALKSQYISNFTDTNIANYSGIDASTLAGKTITVSYHVYIPVGSRWNGMTVSLSDEGTIPGTTVADGTATLVGGSWVRVWRRFSYSASATGTRNYVARINVPAGMNPRVNYFLNPSFEDGTTTGSNTFAGTGRNVAVTNSTAVGGWTGTRALQYLSGTGKGTTGFRYIGWVNTSNGSVVPSTSTVFSQWIYSPVPLNMYYQNDITDSSGTYLSSISGANAFFIPAGVWTRVYAIGTPTSTASRYSGGIGEITQHAFPFRENLSQNPSFEVNITGWLCNLGTLARSTAQFYSGTASLLCTVSTSSGGFGPYHTTYTGGRIPVVAGQTYTWSMYVRDINTAVSYQATVEFYNSLTAGSNVGVISGTATPINNTGWTRVTVTGVAPAGALGAIPTIYSATGATVGTQAYFDGALFEQETAFNLVNNPSFDVNLTHWAQYGVASSSTRITTDSNSGQGCLRIAPTTGTGYLGITQSTRIPVTASQNYTFSTFYKRQAGTGTLSLAVEWYTSAAVYLSSSTFNVPNTTTGIWQQLSGTAAAPATAAYCFVDVFYQSYTLNTDSALIDDVQMTNTATLQTFRNSDYFDGSTGGTYQRWTGTAHQTNSIDSPPVFVDAVVAEPAPRFNATRNPQFRTDTAGWTVNSGSVAATLTRSTNLTGIGDTRLSSALRATSPGGGSAWHFLMGKVDTPQNFFQSGVQYTASFFARSISGSTTPFSFWFSNGPSAANPDNSVAFTLTTSWQRITKTFTATSGARVDTEWHVDMPNTAFTAEFTGFMVERSGTTNTFWDSSYFDGGTVTGYEWVGGANASRSVETAPIYFDAALAEESTTLNPYFDGSTDGVNGTASWLSTAHGSASFLDSDVRVNLCNNPSFEIGSTTGWSSYNLSTLSIATTVSPPFGANALSVAVANNTRGAIYVPPTIVPALTTVTISAYVKGTTGATILFSGRPTGTDNSYISEGNGAISVTLTSGWQRISTTFTGPSVAFKPAIQFYTTSSGADTFYIDGVLIETGSTLLPYFDGSSTYGSWSGTSGNSTSKITRNLLDISDLAPAYVVSPTYYSFASASDWATLDATVQAMDAKVDQTNVGFISSTPIATYADLGNETYAQILGYYGIYSNILVLGQLLVAADLTPYVTQAQTQQLSAESSLSSAQVSLDSILTENAARLDDFTIMGA
jgi:hypothetical protein